MSTRDVYWLENSVHFWKVLGSILATTNCFHENILIWLVQVQYTRKIVLVLLPEAIREAWSDKVTTGTTLAMKGMFKVLKSQVQIHLTVTVLYKKTIVFCTSKVSREIFDIVFFFLSRDARIRWIVFGWKLFFPFRKKVAKNWCLDRNLLKETFRTDSRAGFELGTPAAKITPPLSWLKFLTPLDRSNGATGQMLLVVTHS